MLFLKITCGYLAGAGFTYAMIRYGNERNWWDIDEDLSGDTSGLVMFWPFVWLFLLGYFLFAITPYYIIKFVHFIFVTIKYSFIAWFNNRRNDNGC